MSGFELNKLAAAILIAGIIAMVIGSVTNALYKPNLNLAERGFKVEVVEAANNDSAAPQDLPIKIGQLMAKADMAKGKDDAGKCAVCHNFEKDGATKIGPDLWNIVESPRGKKEGFTYSSAMLAKGGSWTYEDLFHFLKSPRSFIPGTKMGFAGFRKEEDIANTIAFLRSLSDSPKPLPAIEP